MEFRSDDRWLELFESAQRSAFHLEVRDSYAEPEESAPLRRFLAGEPEPPDGYDKNDWIELIEALADRGVTMSRIRVVTEPLSGYQRWLLSVAGSSVSAGEDIRYIPRHLAGETPLDDWWLFDDELVAFNLVDAAGKPVGAAVTNDPGVAAYCRVVRQRLWDRAIPYTEFAASVSIQR
ncbi:hypothetical protein IU486_11170 [Streptomyces gardneri]|uniref:DUF6879 family protein n=1 Tax=Nocardia TaxID=1817 RepID=UPI00135A2E55|nr:MULTISPECIES: DUF6879 family protein [Nocardia]MBF6165334.1 hypothetical protein [Streptomyces gardneri]MBF6206959.1 hypothetical protein [Streptomyces gardneri]